MTLKSWKEIPPGGLIEDAGNSEQYETGSWRSHRPVIDMGRCTHCMICWVYCPDSSIIVRDGKLAGVDLDHCKGCGICARECPRKAITMVEEGSITEGAQ
ncbi:MAG: 4Fe-4S binding protein [Chloroflexota bacterium]|nr:4Fe-4S binding protein [Chloroflexota bacterium]